MGKDDRSTGAQGGGADTERAEVSIRPVRNGYIVKSKYGWWSEATRELACKRALELLPPVADASAGAGRGNR